MPMKITINKKLAPGLQRCTSHFLAKKVYNQQQLHVSFTCWRTFNRPNDDDDGAACAGGGG